MGWYVTLNRTHLWNKRWWKVLNVGMIKTRIDAPSLLRKRLVKAFGQF